MCRHRTSGINLTVSFSLFILLIAADSLWARVTTSQEARLVVAGWLADSSEPFGVQLGTEIADVETFTGNAGEPVYYVVRLNPTGFVVVSADDLVEPILAFTDAEDYEPSAEDPLTALVTGDLTERIAAAYDRPSGQLQAQSATDTQAKWHELMSRASLSHDGIGVLGRQTISDLRVAPLTKTRWSQSNVCSDYCYNYYTPNHYLCGCVATAMAQVMYYHRYPAAGIGRRPYTVRVGGQEQVVYSRGSDGIGGPYLWSDMVPIPGCSTTTRQRQAIGALCLDAGAAVRMEYGVKGSFADAYVIAEKLKTVFKFSNAVNGANNGKDIDAGLAGMINPNLDAAYPVLLALMGSGGHAVVADGYGYDVSATTRTLYHHLNMGWAGTDDMWYNLPDAGKYNSVVACIYNVFPSGKGEIISGRVFDASGRPVANAVVRAKFQISTYEATTDDKGIYALAKLPSDSTFVIEAGKVGMAFSKQTIATGVSRDWKTSAGNKWGVDFVATSMADSDRDEDVDFADFAFLANRPWDYRDLAAFVATWLTGVAPRQTAPAELPVVVN